LVHLTGIAGVSHECFLQEMHCVNRGV